MRILHIDDGLKLVPLRMKSAHEIFRAINLNREHLRQWLPFIDYTTGVANTEQFIHSVLNNDCPKKDMIFEIRKQGQFLGLIALKEVDYLNHKTEIGYWITEEHQGKGIVTKCCQALINHAFEELKMNRIQIKTAVGNTRSKHIPERLGFTYEGTERAGELLNDEYVDLLVFSLLREDESDLQGIKNDEWLFNGAKGSNR